jgi:bacteriocin biosynthesis cyclodehydratase domain-containing protein
MYDLEGRLTSIVPGQTPCLACLYPETPPNWKREFPVISPIASTVGCLAAMEVIKLLTGLGQPLTGKLLTFDLRDMIFRTVAISRRPNCPVCGSIDVACEASL